MRIPKMDYKEGAKNLKEVCGENPDRVDFYTVCDSVAKSGLSAVIRVYVIKDNHPISIAYGRVNGCGLDRGHEACYNIFRYAYPHLRYQEKLHHHWL